MGQGRKKSVLEGGGIVKRPRIRQDMAADCVGSLKETGSRGQTTM